MSGVKIRNYKRYYKSFAFAFYFSSAFLSFYSVLLSRNYKNIEKLGIYLNSVAIATSSMLLLSLVSMMVCRAIERNNRRAKDAEIKFDESDESKVVRIEGSEEEFTVVDSLKNDSYVVKREGSNIPLIGKYYVDHSKFVFEKPNNFRFNTFSCVLMTAFAVSSLVAIHGITKILYETQNMYNLFDFKNPLVCVNAFVISISLISMSTWIVKNIFSNNEQIPTTGVEQSSVEQKNVNDQHAK